MKTYDKIRLGLVAGFAMVALVGSTVAARAAGSTLLVIPSRFTVVQFSFDVARVRSLYLVAYDRNAVVPGTQLYAWSVEKSDWIKIDPAALSSGELFSEKPSRVVVVGDDATLPPEVLSAAAGAGRVQRVTSLQLVDLANTLNADMNFTAEDWRWLAKRYGFTLEDKNVERRRYGRYGPPGGKASRPVEGSDSAAETLAPMSLESAPAEAPLPAYGKELAPATKPQTMVIPAPAAAAVEKSVPAQSVAVPKLAEPADMAPENK